MMLKRMSVHYPDPHTYPVKRGRQLLCTPPPRLRMIAFASGETLGVTVIAPGFEKATSPSPQRRACRQLQQENFASRWRDHGGKKAAGGLHAWQTTWDGSLDCLRPRGLIVFRQRLGARCRR